MEALTAESHRIGKPAWRAMLEYVAALHARSTHPPRSPFPFAWEDIGPGYCYGPAFGHWDIVHAVLDVMPAAPEHARQQILNNLSAQQPDGFVPGSIWLRQDPPTWSTAFGHPPVWPIAVQDYAEQTRSTELIAEVYDNLIRQIAWFEARRRAEPCGFFYTDILDHQWESGVDEGIRFLDVKTGPLACVDATAHVYALYESAADWSTALGTDAAPYKHKAETLRSFIQQELFADRTGFFHDIWAVKDENRRPLSIEGMWPVVVGAATAEQAERVIEENLLSPSRFRSRHPVTSVAMDDPHFEYRMWRGPAWNSMTYWAARGCLRYGSRRAAKTLLEAALDCSALQFERTGTVWEFYHPGGESPELVMRKPHTPFNMPCRDYLGHNPLMAMARMFDAA